MASDETSKHTTGTVPISDWQFARLVRTDRCKGERGARGGYCSTIGCPRAWCSAPLDNQLYGNQDQQYRCTDCADIIAEIRMAGGGPDEQQIVSKRGITPPEVDPTTELAEIRGLVRVCNITARLTGICGERGQNSAAEEALFEEIDEAESEITQRFAELDDWISSGGQLPQQWQHVQAPGHGRDGMGDQQQPKQTPPEIENEKTQRLDLHQDWLEHHETTEPHIRDDQTREL